MEKVWDELKKIESQAEQIRAEAAESAKRIAIVAEQDAEKLIANSKTYANEEARQLRDATVDAANRDRELKLKQSDVETEKLNQRVEERLEKASDIIVKTVLGENSGDSDSKIR